MRRSRCQQQQQQQQQQQAQPNTTGSALVTFRPTPRGGTSPTVRLARWMIVGTMWLISVTLVWRNLASGSKIKEEPIKINNSKYHHHHHHHLPITQTVVRLDENFDDDKFDWNDIDVQPSHGDCGLFKCFLPSRSNATVGYLIAMADPHYHAMVQAVELAHHLQGKFGAKHLYHSDPFQITVPSLTWFQQLQAAVHQPLRILANKTATRVFALHDDDDEYDDDDKNNKENTTFTQQQGQPPLPTLAIQKVIRAPQPVLTYGCCKGTKPLAMQRALPKFGAQIPNHTAFFQTLQADRRVVSNALYYHDTLWFDFQGLIDVKGNFWFIDLDGGHDVRRLAVAQKNGYVKKRLDLLDDIVAQLKRIVSKS